MPTCLFYVDESGSPDHHHVPIRSGETPLFCLSGIAFQLDDWRSVDREYLGKKVQYFRQEVQQSGKRAEHWEAKDLCQPRNRNSQRRHAFLRDLLDFCQRYQTRTFAIVFIKNPHNPTSPETLYTLALQHLAERFNAFVVEHAGFDNGIVIADRRKHRLDYQVGTSYLSYIFGHETGKQLTALQEGPLFAHSGLTAGLQIAHNIASLIYGSYYHHDCRGVAGALDYSHLQTYWQRLKDLEFKSKHKYDGRQLYGYRRHDFR